jgi:hypothetical protein
MGFTIERAIAVAECHLEMAERVGDRWTVTRAISLIRRLQREQRRRNLMLEPVLPRQPTLAELVEGARKIARLAERTGHTDLARRARLELLEMLRLHRDLATADEVVVMTVH